jgi:uncharacterized protein YdhG (YjbR/CyaY superfamily)
MNAKKAAASQGKSYEGFTDEERGAMKEHAREMKAAALGADLEAAQLAKIAELPADERAMAERIGAIVKEYAPGLTPKLWYGMPGWAKGGKIVCFFQPAGKFKSRYSTFGFNDSANLDDGDLWPTAFALTKLTPAVEKQLRTLVKKAAS